MNAYFFIPNLTQSFFLSYSEGEYGVGAGHMPYVAQLKPGVLQILHEEGTAEPEKYFVAGGYALTHADSTTVRCCRQRELIYGVCIPMLTDLYLFFRTWCAPKRSNWTTWTRPPFRVNTMLPRQPLIPLQPVPWNKRKPKLPWKSTRPWESPLVSLLVSYQNITSSRSKFQH